MLEIRIDGISLISGSWPLDVNKPTVVFIHGSGGSATFWKAQLKGLSDKMNTIAIDLPGHGRSEGLGMDSIKAYSDVVADIIFKAEIPNPVVCGLSMGGAISLQLLIDRKDLIKAGILINTGAKLRVLPLILNMVQNDYKSYIDSFAATAASPATDYSVMLEIMEAAAQCNPYVVYNDFMACDSFDVMNRLSDITQPVLVMTASEDNLSPPKYGTYLGANIRNAKTVSIEGAGHMSPVEKPDDVNKVIADYVNSLAF